MIVLTELSALADGLYWARKITGDRDLGRGPWLIVQLQGGNPFLSLEIVFVSNGEDWKYPKDARYPDVINPNEWEFGPRIDIPSGKDEAIRVAAWASERITA